MSLRYNYILVIGLLFGVVLMGEGCKRQSLGPAFDPVMINPLEYSYYSLLKDGNFKRCYDYLYPPIRNAVTRDQYVDFCKHTWKDIVWPANSLRTDEFTGPPLEAGGATSFIVWRLKSREVASVGGHATEFGSTDVWIADGTNLWVAPLYFFDVKLKMLQANDVSNFVTNRTTISDLFHK